MKSVLMFYPVFLLLAVVSTTSWQDVVITVVGGIVTVAGIYQVITLAKLKKDVETIHTTTNSLSEKLQDVTAKNARTEGRDEERAKVDAHNLEREIMEARIAEGVRAELAKKAVPTTAITPIEATVAETVVATKEKVDVIDKNVEEVHGKVLEDVASVITKGVTKGINDAKG